MINRVEYVGNSASRQNMTVQELRKGIRELTKQANVILYEGGKNTQSNREYFLRGFHDTRTGGITSDVRVNFLNKAQAKLLYNQLASFINADTESQSYKEYLDKVRAKSVKTMKETLRNKYDVEMSDADIEELFAIKEQFPELFESDANFYKEVLSMSKTLHADIVRNEKGQIQTTSFMQNLLDAKKELLASGSELTPSKVKALALKKAGVDRRTKEYRQNKLVTP